MCNVVVPIEIFCCVFTVRNDFIDISCFLKNLPLKSQQQQSEFFM